MRRRQPEKPLRSDHDDSDIKITIHGNNSRDRHYTHSKTTYSKSGVIYDRFVPGPTADCNIEVTGLPDQATVYDLQHHFVDFGTILSVCILSGIGIISFDSERSALAALQKFQGRNKLNIKVKLYDKYSAVQSPILIYTF